MNYVLRWLLLKNQLWGKIPVLWFLFYNFPKSPDPFLPHKRAHKIKGNIFIDTEERRVEPKNNSIIYQNIYHIFINLIISNFPTKYPYLSTTANIISHTHKLGKQNRQPPSVINDPSNATIPTSHIHDKSNEIIDVASK